MKCLEASVQAQSTDEKKGRAERDHVDLDGVSSRSRFRSPWPQCVAADRSVFLRHKSDGGDQGMVIERSPARSVPAHFTKVFQTLELVFEAPSRFMSVSAKYAGGQLLIVQGVFATERNAFAGGITDGFNLGLIHIAHNPRPEARELSSERHCVFAVFHSLISLVGFTDACGHRR